MNKGKLFSIAIFVICAIYFVIAFSMYIHDRAKKIIVEPTKIHYATPPIVQDDPAAEVPCQVTDCKG